MPDLLAINLSPFWPTHSAFVATRTHTLKPTYTYTLTYTHTCTLTYTHTHNGVANSLYITSHLH